MHGNVLQNYFAILIAQNFSP